MNNKINIKGSTLAMFIVIASLILATVVSGCYNKGYGCKGRARTITGEDVKKKDSRYD
jgi:hypothetical protein